MTTLQVLAVGPQALIQDLGRPGHLGIGVAPSGVIDAASLQVANRAVGNPEGAAGIEVLLGGLVLQPDAAVVLMVTGAPAPITVDNRPVPFGEPVTVAAGSRLSLGRPPRALRSYVAVRGGIDVPLVLGSRSTDTSSGLGPPPLRAGDRLAIGSPPDHPVAHAGSLVIPGGSVRLRADLGPRDDLLTGAAKDRLAQCDWRVSAHTDRIGVRLEGPRLALTHTGELPSAPIIAGAIQVPPDGQPIVFLHDHPTTGGYPIVACVRAPDLGSLGQAAPGEVVRITLRENQI